MPAPDSTPPHSFAPSLKDPKLFMSSLKAGTCQLIQQPSQYTAFLLHHYFCCLCSGVDADPVYW